LLSCSITCDGQPAGQVVLANKANGFIGHDAIILQTVTHLLSKRLTNLARQAPSPVLPQGLRMALERSKEGILVLEGHQLLPANSTWALWTGFAPEDLLQSGLPYPFWVSHRDLAANDPAGGARLRPSHASADWPGATDWGPLPFRRRDGSVFWCQVESVVENFSGRQLTIAFLRPSPASIPEGQRLLPTTWAFPFLPLQTLADQLPFALALTDGEGRLLGANPRFFQMVSPTFPRAGQALADCFTPLSASVLEGVLQRAAAPEKG